MVHREYQFSHGQQKLGNVLPHFGGLIPVMQQRSFVASDSTDRVVELYSTVGTALIIESSTGISYTNQTGGTSCLQPYVEGVLVPFENDHDLDYRFISLEIDLHKYFHWKWGTTGATSGISEEDADALDQMLKDRKIIDWFAVNRDQLKNSHEAWIHVTVKSDHVFYCHGFGPYPRPGILTWANSD
jgi:hypothetical protein